MLNNRDGNRHLGYRRYVACEFPLYWDFPCLVWDFNAAVAGCPPDQSMAIIFIRRVLLLYHQRTQDAPLAC